MVRVKEVLVLEDTSFLDEKLSSGAFELTFRKMIYIMAGGLMSYKLIDSYKAPDILLGVIIIGVALALAFYPAKSLRLESIFVGGFSYLLGGFFTPDLDKVKNMQKQQKKPKPKTKIETVKNTAKITKIVKEPSKEITKNSVEEKEQLSNIKAVDKRRNLWLDYILAATSGAFSLLLFRILKCVIVKPSLIIEITTILLLFAVSTGVFVSELLYIILRLKSG
jgi:hypothetical protein